MADPNTDYGKRQAKKAAKIAKEQAIFQMACIRKGLTPTTGPSVFRVSRPTYWAWMNNKRKIPHEAFVRLVELDNQMDPAQWERLKDMQRLAERMNLTLFAKPPRRRGRPANQITTNEPSQLGGEE